MDERKTEEVWRRLDKERAALRRRIRVKATLPEGIVGSAPGVEVTYPLVSMSFEYDREEDVLFAWLGEPTPALTQDAEHGVHLRIDVDTYDIVGFEVLDFSKASNARDLLDRVFPGLYTALLQRQHVTVQMLRNEATAKLKKLVPESWPALFDASSVIE